MVTAGHVGSKLMTVVTKVGKVTVPVNKEMSAAVGESTMVPVAEYKALTSFADLEYLVTP